MTTTYTTRDEAIERHSFNAWRAVWSDPHTQPAGDDWAELETSASVTLEGHTESDGWVEVDSIAFTVAHADEADQWEQAEDVLLAQHPEANDVERVTLG